MKWLAPARFGPESNNSTTPAEVVANTLYEQYITTVQPIARRFFSNLLDDEGIEFDSERLEVAEFSSFLFSVHWGAISSGFSSEQATTLADHIMRLWTSGRTNQLADNHAATDLFNLLGSNEHTGGTNKEVFHGTLILKQILGDDTFAKGDLGPTMTIWEWACDLAGTAQRTLSAAGGSANIDWS